MDEQNTKKLTDKVFMRLVLTSILSVLLCVVCLSAATYAWFTVTTYGMNNTIHAADGCDLTATVDKDATQIIVVDTDEAVKIDDAEGVYTVTLELPRGSASGYLVITVDGEDYYSDYLRRDDVADQTITFTLNVQSVKDVTFTARWGIYSCDCDVKNGETLNIG